LFGLAFEAVSFAEGEAFEAGRLLLGSIISALL
jgi:hypothetical protein